MFNYPTNRPTHESASINVSLIVYKCMVSMKYAISLMSIIRRNTLPTLLLFPSIMDFRIEHENARFSPSFFLAFHLIHLPPDLGMVIGPRLNGYMQKSCIIGRVITHLMSTDTGTANDLQILTEMDAGTGTLVLICVP